MKTKIALKYISIVLLISVSLSCTKDDFYPCEKGRGNIVSVTRILPSFALIDFRMDADIEVRYAAVPSIEITGFENQNGLIDTDVSGNKLIIDTKQCLRNTRFHFVLYTPEVGGFKLQGSSDATIGPFVQNSSMKLEVAGSGKIVSTVSAPFIAVKVSGSGNIVLNGLSDELLGEISGSGSVDAYGVAVKIATVNVAGSGQLKTTVLNELDVNISGSGRVYYKGNPLVNSNISGSGKVIKQ